ncbi:UNVERIFIED_CONTAM: hypothetical protein K2H54_044755 [Gekko kuhli]
MCDGTFERVSSFRTLGFLIPFRPHTTGLLPKVPRFSGVDYQEAPEEDEESSFWKQNTLPNTAHHTAPGEGNPFFSCRPDAYLRFAQESRPNNQISIRVSISSHAQAS